MASPEDVLKIVEDVGRDVLAERVLKVMSSRCVKCERVGDEVVCDQCIVDRYVEDYPFHACMATCVENHMIDLAGLRQPEKCSIVVKKGRNEVYVKYECRVGR